MPQPTLKEILQQPLDDATRLVIRHERTATFRWLGLLEMVLIGLAFCCCVVPVMIALLIATGGEGGWDGDIELFSWNRLYHHWHDLVVCALNAEGETIATARVQLVSQQDGDPLLAAILQAADRQGVVVVETIGSAAAAPVQLWYGGRPLLAEPGLPTSDRACQRLEALGCTIDRQGDRTALLFSTPEASRAILILKVLGLSILFPMLLHHQVRQAFGEALAELRGEGAPSWSLEVRADEIVSRREQGGAILDEQRIPGHRVVGFSWSRMLTYGNHAEIAGPQLRVALVDGFDQLHVPSQLGPLLRDWLTRESLDHRGSRPELGLTHGEPPPTRCPYCGALYIFMPGTGCPACGGWPDKLG